MLEMEAELRCASVILVLGRCKQENQKFEAILGYMRSYFKKRLACKKKSPRGCGGNEFMWLVSRGGELFRGRRGTSKAGIKQIGIKQRR